MKLAEIAPTIAFVFGTPAQFRALLERYASAPAALLVDRWVRDGRQIERALNG